MIDSHEWRYYNGVIASRQRAARNVEMFRESMHERTELDSAFKAYSSVCLQTYRKPLEIYRWLVYR